MDRIRPGQVSLSWLVALMRPHQWIKNGFVLVGLLFGHQWGDTAMLRSVGFAFFSFCAMSSMVYVVNDIVDVESDRRHPTKRRRPIASGAVSKGAAEALAIVLGCVGLLLAALVSSKAVALVCCYAAMNFAYSYRLKHMVIVDVFVISAGFMLRILVGTLGVGIAPSSWLMLCGMMLTLLIGFGKRRAELTAASANGQPTRKVLDQYDLSLIDQLLAMSAACSIISYSVYAVSADTIKVHGTDKLIYTVPFIVYGISRYLFLLNRRGAGQDTAHDLMTDKHLIATSIGWFAVTAALLW